MPTELREDLVAEANEALARSSVYRLLSQVFAYPTPAGVEQLREEDLPLATAAAGPLPEDVRDALAETAAAFEGASAERLEEVYRDTFSHVHSADCPLYETDYTVREIWRQSQELADLAGFYRAFGMEQEAERPDNVAVELEFMHLVAYKAAWALVQGEQRHAETCRLAEESFLGDHVLKWIPGLATRAAVLAERGPYAAAARLAKVFLRTEAERFGLSLVEATPQPAMPPVALEMEGTALCEEER